MTTILPYVSAAFMFAALVCGVLAGRFAAKDNLIARPSFVMLGVTAVLVLIGYFTSPGTILSIQLASLLGSSVAGKLVFGVVLNEVLHLASGFLVGRFVLADERIQRWYNQLKGRSVAVSAPQQRDLSFLQNPPPDNR